MSDHINENKQFINKYDNSDLAVTRDVNDIAGAYTAYEEMKAYKMYLETLKLEAEIAMSTADIVYKFGTNAATIKVKDLADTPSEFEQIRRYILAKLNAGMTPDKLKKLMADFDTTSKFELSGKIANHVLDKKRRADVEKEFDPFA